MYAVAVADLIVLCAIACALFLLLRSVRHGDLSVCRRSDCSADLDGSDNVGRGACADYAERLRFINSH